jgi:DNA repair exonuclease SbcCD ATPase subunit
MEDTIVYNAVQMSFGLEALFEERLEAFPAEPASILHAASGHVEAVIKSLVKERDELQTQVKNHESTIEHLERRVYAKVASDAELPVDVVRRLNRLEKDCQHLRDQNTRLRDNLTAAESETATLRDTIAEKSQKMKGANKKTKNAKEVAVKVEEKAKDAVNDKQRHLASERKMRKERNDALAALAKEEKIAEDLREELKIEQSGRPHLRDTEGSKSNHTTVIVPIEVRIRRIDYYRTLRRLRSSPGYLAHVVQEWHVKWTAEKEDEDGDENEEYSEDYEGDDLDDEYENKLYGGMVEGGDIMTGVEHDSWRSMKGLEEVCRNTHAQYNG